MLHMIGVVPPDWTFRFMGSEASVRFINESRAIQHQVQIGKLELTYIPENLTTSGGEEISQFLTNLWVYETLMAPATWVLIWQTDSKSPSASRPPLPLPTMYDEAELY